MPHTNRNCLEARVVYNRELYRKHQTLHSVQKLHMVIGMFSHVVHVYVFALSDGS